MMQSSTCSQVYFYIEIIYVTTDINIDTDKQFYALELEVVFEGTRRICNVMLHSTLATILLGIIVMNGCLKYDFATQNRASNTFRFSYSFHAFWWR